MKQAMTLKIRVDSGITRKTLTAIMAELGYWVTEEAEDGGYLGKDYYVLIRGEFEVMEE